MVALVPAKVLGLVLVVVVAVVPEAPEKQVALAEARPAFLELDQPVLRSAQAVLAEALPAAQEHPQPTLAVERVVLEERPLAAQERL